MATAGSSITKAEIVSNYYTRIESPAYLSAVFWSGNTPTYINASQLAGRDVTSPTTANLPESAVTATSIRTMAKTYARLTTVYRRARSGLITSSGTTQDRTDVCRLIDAYIINYTYSDGSAVIAGQPATAAGINGFFNSIRTTAAQAQTTAGVVDLRVCHSSCHSNCHGSRGRR